MEREMTIQRRTEISTAGRTRVTNLYAKGYLGRDGRFHPVSCVGTSFVKKVSALPASEKQAA